MRAKSVLSVVIQQSPACGYLPSRQHYIDTVKKQGYDNIQRSGLWTQCQFDDLLERMKEALLVLQPGPGHLAELFFDLVSALAFSWSIDSIQYPIQIQPPVSSVPA